MCSLMLFLCFVEYSRLTSTHLLPLQESKVGLQILNTYQEYDLIAHFDNTTTQVVDDLLSDYDRPKILYNYDITQPIRPLGFKFINFVYLKKTKRFEFYSKLLSNIYYKDVVMLMVQNYSMTDDKIEYMDGLNRSSSLVVVDLFKRDCYYAKYYYGMGNERILAKIIGPSPVNTIKVSDQVDIFTNDTFTRTMDSLTAFSNTPISNKINDGYCFTNKLNLTKFINTFKDFNGHMMHVGFISYMPYIGCNYKYDGNKKKCVLMGKESPILLELSKKFNFQFTMYEIKYYNDLISMIHDRIFDLGLGGIMVTVRRSLLVDYAASMEREFFTAVYYKGHKFDPSANYNYILLPFSSSVWCLLIVIVIVLAVLLTIGYQIKHSKHCEPLYLMVIRGLTEQSDPYTDLNVIKCSLILALYWYFNIITLTYYKSQLTSISINTRNKEPTTLTELIDKNYGFSAVRATALDDVLAGSNDPFFLQINKKLTYVGNYCENIITALKTQSTGSICPVRKLRGQILKDCKGQLTPEDLSQLRLLPLELFPTLVAWPLQQGAPFRDEFSNFFQQIVASGLHLVWIPANDADIIRYSNEINSKPGAVPLNINTFLKMFLTLGIGLVIAIVVFVLELVYRDYNQNHAVKSNM